MTHPRFVVERWDYPALCEHASVAQCRANGPDDYGNYWHDLKRWHVWDMELGDYAAGTGAHQFERRGDAEDWVDARLDDEPDT